MTCPEDTAQRVLASENPPREYLHKAAELGPISLLFTLIGVGGSFIGGDLLAKGKTEGLVFLVMSAGLLILSKDWGSQAIENFGKFVEASNRRGTALPKEDDAPLSQ